MQPLVVTPVSRHASDDQRIDTSFVELLRKPGAEKGTWKLLGNNDLTVGRLDTFRPRSERTANIKNLEDRHLAIEDTTITAAFLIDDPGIENGYASRPCRIANAQSRRQRIIYLGIKRAVLVEVGLDEVDEN